MAGHLRMSSFNMTGVLLPLCSVKARFDLDTPIVEDSSPLIDYAPAGAWIDTPNTDPLAAVSS